MRIHVNRIPEDGLTLDTTYDPQALDIARPDALPAAPVHLVGVARKEEDELLVEATIRCVLEYTCARCLTCFESVMNKACLFNYDVSDRQIVDITEDVRQEIMLDYPLVPVCQDDCRGLCLRCGHNLNESDCAHSIGVKDDQGAE